MQKTSLALATAGLLALMLQPAAFAADTQPTAAVMPKVASADDIKNAPPEIQPLLTDSQWNQAPINPGSASLRLELRDADGKAISASDSGWSIKGVDQARNGWLTRWALVPSKAGGKLPKAKYIIW